MGTPAPGSMLLSHHTERTPDFRTAQSCASDPMQAVRELAAGLALPATAAVLFFSSPAYDAETLAAALRQEFAGINVIGCIAAGQFGPLGQCPHSLCGVSFSTSRFRAVHSLVTDLEKCDVRQSHDLVQEMFQHLEQEDIQLSWSSCALLLSDGLSLAAESTARNLRTVLGSIPMVGGAASDALQFRQTLVYANGEFHDRAAVLLLLRTSLPFYIFRTQHFVPTSVRMVVTQADAAHRTVYQIDGLPAAKRYAELVGNGSSPSSYADFAAHPVAVLIDGQPFVRSIREVGPDGSLHFGSVIENGVVLRLVCGVNLIHDLEDCFAKIERKIGPPQLVVACNCLLRHLESEAHGQTAEVERIFQRYNTVGFNGYGEHYQGIYMNYALVGVAFGQEGHHGR